jgi:hypothetical protein
MHVQHAKPVGDNLHLSNLLLVLLVLQLFQERNTCREYGKSALGVQVKYTRSTSCPCTLSVLSTYSELGSGVRYSACIASGLVLVLYMYLYSCHTLNSVVECGTPHVLHVYSNCTFTGSVTCLAGRGGIYKFVVHEQNSATHDSSRVTVRQIYTVFRFHVLTISSIKIKSHRRRELRF